MKVVIIEDEKAAVRNLKALLQEVKPEVELEATLDSIAAVLDWFAIHSMPDMLFMDIHLADGSALKSSVMWISPVLLFSLLLMMSMPFVRSK